MDALSEALIADVGVAPRVGIVLGSGLGEFADTLEVRATVPYASIRGMAASTVAGHAGTLCFADRGGLPCVLMRGRLHLYEGHPVEQVVFGVRLMAAMGVGTLVLTNAAGGIREDLAVGSLMRIDDHLNLTGHNPLVGAAAGERFADMTRAYDPGLGRRTEEVAARLGVALASGVYAGLLGPSYETPAEIRMLAAMGADAVGMSTVLETIAARQLGVRVLGLSCITNSAAGRDRQPISHGDVQRAAADASERFTALVSGVLDAIAEDAP